MKGQASLWEGERLTLQDAIELTAASLRAYGERYKHWVVAFSGGKDSSATVTVIAHLIESGRVPPPESLTVLYADTRQELPPLQLAAFGIMNALEKRGITTRIVTPPINDRFYVYMFGRGVPPPSNTFRWCTSQLKIEPMLTALTDVWYEAGEKLLMLTGVRIGESAARDQRIAVSCGKNGAECGQGWFQQSTPESMADTLAPILHWRVCHVWDWLMFDAPSYGFPTEAIAETYGGDEATEINARTGCVGCNLASRDLALETVLKVPRWQYLAPLMKLRLLFAELKKPQNRLRKDGSQRRKDGSMPKNLMRLGPLTMKARRWGLKQIKAIQREINDNQLPGMPEVWLINEREEQRILELIKANTWPQGWDGTEPTGDVMLPEVIDEDTVQPLLFTLEAS